MRIIGPDKLIFGVDDLAGAVQFCTDAGLTALGAEKTGAFLAALDGTGIEVRSKTDPSLPPALKTGSMLRQTVYGVVEAAVLDEISTELARDREVHRDEAGAVYAQDDSGFHLKFQVTNRRSLNLLPERVNAPGVPVQRPVNVLGADPDAPALARSLSHVVYFVPDILKAEAFYVERLKFRVADRLSGAGPFLRPAACNDHHTLFFINTPEYMQGLEHFAFHYQGPTEVMLAGTRMIEKGYESFWGPGRHRFASNWFWYFNSPMGSKFEIDADMDTIDDNWIPREMQVSADAAQIVLFKQVEKWLPKRG